MEVTVTAVSMLEPPMRALGPLPPPSKMTFEVLTGTQLQAAPPAPAVDQLAPLLQLPVLPFATSHQMLPAWAIWGNADCRKKNAEKTNQVAGAGRTHRNHRRAGMHLSI